MEAVTMTAASCTRVAVGFGAALLIAGCGGGQGAARSYPVPTSGWHSGEPALTALSIGTLEGGYRHGRFCVWLIGPGQKRPGAIIWPAGYRARRHPLELLNAQGAVVARGGDEIRVGGGSAPVRRRHPCMLGQTSAFWVMSGVSARRPS
jgi:hypothetical protein